MAKEDEILSTFIDLDYSMESFGDRNLIVDVMLKSFDSCIDDDLMKMIKGWQLQDHKQMETYSHKMKGSVSYFLKPESIAFKAIKEFNQETKSPDNLESINSKYGLCLQKLLELRIKMSQFYGDNGTKFDMPFYQNAVKVDLIY